MDNVVGMQVEDGETARILQEFKDAHIDTLQTVNDPDDLDKLQPLQIMTLRHIIQALPSDGDKDQDMAVADIGLHAHEIGKAFKRCTSLGGNMEERLRAEKGIRQVPHPTLDALSRALQKQIPPANDLVADTSLHKVVLQLVAEASTEQKNAVQHIVTASEQELLDLEKKVQP